MAIELKDDLTSWRVTAGVRAREVAQRVDDLADPQGKHAVAAMGYVQRAVDAIAESQRSSWLTKHVRHFTGSDIELAWRLLELAEEELIEAKTGAELLEDVPWLSAIAPAAATTATKG